MSVLLMGSEYAFSISGHREDWMTLPISSVERDIEL